MLAHNCSPFAGCRFAHRTSLHLPGQARLGAVLLQDRAQGGQRVGPQEPASLHRHEPHRPQPGACDSGGEATFFPPERISGKYLTTILHS